jgi:hypothetical protein
MNKFLAASASVLIAIFILGFGIEDLDLGVKKFVGIWEYKAPNAPYGYQDGTINLTKEKRVLKGTVSIGAYTSELQEIQTNKNELSCYVSVEGERVQLELNFDRDSFEGIARSSQGDIPMNGTRASK